MPDPAAGGWAHRAGLLLAAIALAAFAVTLTHSLVWDDPALVEAARRLAGDEGALSFFQHPFTMTDQDLSRVTRYYRPLSSLSLLLDSAVPGGSALPFHLTNLLLYALLTYLVVRLFALLLPWRGAVVTGGLLFALHPLHVEVVAPAFGRTDLLMSVFLLASVLSWQRVRKGLAPRPSLEAAASHLFLLLACLSKETAVVTPFLLLAQSAAEEGVGKEWRRGAIRWLPGWGAVVVGVLLLRGIVLGGAGGGGGWLAVTPETSDAPGLLAAPLATLPAVVEGVARLALPWPQQLLHFPAPGLPAGEVLLGLALGAALLALAFPPRRFRQALVAALWVGVFLLPSVLLPRGGAPMADRFLFLSTVGSSLAAGWAFGRLREWRRGRVLAVGGTVLLAAAAAFLLASYLPVWKDDISLYRAMTRGQPSLPVGWNNLGRTLAREGKWREAADAFREAVRLSPGSARSLSSYGCALEVLGRRTEALEALARAEALEPGWVGGSYNLGLVLRAAGRREEAAAAFRRVVATDPSYFRGHLQLLLTLREAGREGEAEEVRRALERLFPDEGRELERQLQRPAPPSP